MQGKAFCPLTDCSNNSWRVSWGSILRNPVLGETRRGPPLCALLLLLMFLGHWQLLERAGDLRQPCLPTLLLSSPSSSLSLCLSHLLNSSSAPCLSSFFPLLSFFLSQQLPSLSSFSLLLLPSSFSFFSTPCASSRIPGSLDHPRQPTPANVYWLGGRRLCSQGRPSGNTHLSLPPRPDRRYPSNLVHFSKSPSTGPQDPKASWAEVQTHHEEHRAVMESPGETSQHAGYNHSQ